MNQKQKQYLDEKLKQAQDRLNSLIDDFTRYAQARDYANLMRCCSDIILAIAKFDAARVLKSNFVRE